MLIANKKIYKPTWFAVNKKGTSFAANYGYFTDSQQRYPLARFFLESVKVYVIGK